MTLFYEDNYLERSEIFRDYFNYFSINFIEEEPLEYNFSYAIFSERQREHIEHPVLKEMKSENENFMREKDIKFELYPLYINWKKIDEKSFEDDNTINYYFVIFKLFGYFGEAIYEILIETGPKNYNYTHKNFLHELNILYKKLYKKEEIEKNNFCKKLMDIYEDVISLVKNKIIIFKEIPLFLLIFKIYQKYFSCLKDNKKVIESLKNQFIILSYLKNDEYEKIYKRHLKQIDFPKNKADFIKQIKKDYKLYD